MSVQPALDMGRLQEYNLSTSLAKDVTQVLCFCRQSPVCIQQTYGLRVFGETTDTHRALPFR